MAISQYFGVSLDALLNEDMEQAASARKGTDEAPVANGSQTKWRMGFIACLAGAVGLVIWGLLCLLRPDASAQISESSVISINGNGLFLMLCLGAMAIGAALLLKNKK